ncbi:HD domain-containing protein [Bacillus thuringiensis]|nr:HD domain-containing protein [Bacillus thuringiensis]
MGFELRKKESIKHFVDILGLKDPYTKGHSERVAKFATILAKATKKFTDVDLEKFYSACLLHDIGKLRIQKKLNKPTYLINEEYKIIKDHPILGIQLLKDKPLIAECIAGYEDVIYSHHKKWDGSGYPDGLKKEEIPLNARIVAISDAFDAMTSNRVYRNSLSFEEVYEQIIIGAYVQFDPVLVEIFKTVYPLWIRVLKASP